MKIIFKIFIILFILFFYAYFGFSTLWDRGDGLIYDDQLDITWLQDMNYAHTSGYAATLKGNVNGMMEWKTAYNWVDGLSYGGFSDWRLPSAISDGDSVPEEGFVASGEMGYMFYNNLTNPGTDSNTAFQFIDGNGNTVSFTNYQRGGYWTGTQAAYGSRYKWVFNFTNGGSDYLPRKAARFVWPVRDGDTESYNSLGLVSGGALILQSGNTLRLNGS